jgi:membrane-anchored glycerophosphoryl diester phosphodiesterase (GDPDase)
MLATRLVVTVFVLLGSMLCVLPGLYVAVRTMLAEPAAVIEGKNGMSAPQRSFELTKGRSWEFLAILLIAYGLVYAVALGLWWPLAHFPAVNQWYVAACTYLVRDLLSGLTIQILVAAYWASAHPQAMEEAVG